MASIHIVWLKAYITKNIVLHFQGITGQLQEGSQEKLSQVIEKKCDHMLLTSYTVYNINKSIFLKLLQSKKQKR